jgi:uncharacterized membrane protein YdjX (TVP38/TMEM64 family)
MGFLAFARALGPVGPLAALASVLPPLGALALLGTLPAVGGWLQTNDGLGLVVFIAAFTVLGGLALLPTYSPSIVGGWAFGGLHGWLATMLGFAGAATLGYALARAVAGNRLRATLDSHPRSQLLRRALLHADPFKVTASAALMRLPPNSPFALTNLVLAAGGMAFGPYLIGSLIGLAPRAAVAALLGATLSRLDIAHPERSAAALSSVAITLGAALALGWLARREIRRLEAQVRPADRAAPGASVED